MKKNKSFLLIAAVLAFLFTLTPTKILAQENIIDRLDKSLGVKLPAEYDAKVRELIKNNHVFKVKGADDCTAQFIENWMKKDWKIDKQNQLVFLWHSIYKKITNDDLYNPKDGDSNRLQDFNDRVVGMRIRAAGQGYENEIVAYMNQRSAEAQQRSAEAQQRSAEAQQQSVDKGLEALTEIINGFEKYITFFQNMINLDGATQTLANFNQEKNTLLQRAEKLRSGQQSNQHPSATEVENLIKSQEQLLSDLTNQRTVVAKQIYAVIEKNIPEIEKIVNSSTQKNEKPSQYIGEAKQRFAEAQRAISDSKLATAEDRLQSTMAHLRSAMAIQKTLNILSEELDVIITSYNNYKSNDKMLEKLKSLKPEVEKVTTLYKRLDLDIKGIVREKIGDETKYKEFLKFYGIE